MAAPNCPLTSRLVSQHSARTGRQNPSNSGNRSRHPCGFFASDVSCVGRAAAIQHGFGRKPARRLLAVLNLPTPTGAARQNVSSWSLDPTGDVQ